MSNMSKKIFSLKIHRIAVIIVSLVMIFALSASAALSTSWAILGNTVEGCNKTILKNSTASFTLDDFNAALTVSTADMLNFKIETLPSSELGSLLLGDKNVETGQLIPANQINELRFVPQMDKTGLTKFEYTLSGSEETYYCSVNVVSDGNNAPKAMAKTYHTLMNMRIMSVLPAYDADSDITVYEVVKEPSKGIISVNSVTGFFEYSPKSNAKGSDSFTFRVVDASGNVSESVKVNVKIEKVADTLYYADMTDHWAHYAAVMLERDNIMSGQIIGGKNVFLPNENVSRANFVLMVMKAVGITPTSKTTDYTGFSDDALIPAWMKASVSCAYENKIISGNRSGGKLYFDGDKPLTRAEAVTIISNALALEPSQTSLSVFGYNDAEDAPVWSRQAFSSLIACGVISGTPSNKLNASEFVSRAETAKILYAVVNYLDK